MKTYRLLFLLFFGYTTNSYAQTTPPIDAGALQRQIGDESKSAIYKFPKQITPLTEEKAAKQKDSDSEFRITVKKFVFKGNTLIGDEELNKSVSSYLNRPVTFYELQNAAAAVGDLYRSKGWVVKSFLPKQDVVNNTVIIQIIEAKFGKIKIESEANARPLKKRIGFMVNDQQKTGQFVNTKKIDRSLLLIDDLPGVAASGRLEEGKRDGETDLAIKQSRESFFKGTLIGDNEGARSTGAERLHGLVQLSDILHLNDLSSLYLLTAEGVNFGRFEQTFPVGYNGLKVGFNASALNYDIVSKEFRSLNSKGNSNSAGLQASYPVIRARDHNLYFNLNYDHKYFNNDSQGSRSSNYRIDNYTAAINANALDKIFGGGSTDANVGITIGKLDLGVLDTGETQSLEGEFQKIFYNLSRQQLLSEQFSFFTMLSGQFSSDTKLDSSEMFYLGGPNGIRAYPVSEGGGVDAHMINAELRWRFAPNYQLTGFYDYGYVHNKKPTDSYELKGAGAKLSWQSNFGLNVNAIWSHRIGDNPNPTTSGKDQDGSLKKNRFWISISQNF